MRNERIVGRVDAGELIIEDCEKLILHQGSHPSSKKVCVHGKMYVNMSIASKTLVMSNGYISDCIRGKRHDNDIFEISDEFYEEYKDSENITKNMFIAFDHFYINH